MSAKLRVFMTTDAVGGVWQYSVDLCRSLCAQEVEVGLALLGPPPGPTQRLAAEAIAGLSLIETGEDLDWIAADSDQVEASAEHIAELADSYEAQIVHLNSPALAASVDFHAPVLAVSHSCVGTWWRAAGTGAFPNDLAWRDRLHRLGLHRADMVLTPSHSFAAATLAHHGLRQMPRVIHNGRVELPLAEAAMHDFAFTAGRLWDSGKNVEVLDRAAGRLTIPFKAAGACSAPHGEAISFDHLYALGRLDEAALGRHLAARPVFVSAARYEPFGLAVLEAASAGCALVLSDIPTFRELWDGVAHFVDPDDDAGFAEAIEMLIGDAALRLSRGEAARRHARRYSAATMGEATMAAYRTLLQARSADRLVRACG